MVGSRKCPRCLSLDVGFGLRGDVGLGKTIKSVFIFTAEGGDYRVDCCPWKNGTKLSIDLEGHAMRMGKAYAGRRRW